MNIKKYLFETCKRISSLILCVAFLFAFGSGLRSWENVRAEEKIPNKKIGSSADIKFNETEAEVDNFTVKEGKKISVFNTVAMDILFPGGGHFYRGDYTSGFSFMLMKMAGFYSSWYFYGLWKEREADYNRAKNSSLSSGEIEYYKRKYDRAAQYVTFSIAGNIILYAASIIMNLNSVNKNNENAYPVFELGYLALNETGGGRSVSVKFRYRF